MISPGTQRVFGLLVGLGGHKEILHADFSHAPRAVEFHLGVQGDQDGRQARRAYEICRPGISQDGVVAVVAVGNQWLALVNRQQSKPGAIIPAARALAEVAAHCSHAADLRAADAFRRLHQGGVVLPDFGALHQLFQGHGRAQAQPRLCW